MLTAQLISYYNHLLATTVLYFTLVDPLQDLAITYVHQDEGESFRRLPSLVMADKPHDDDNRDYYQVLGVTKEATKHEIHKAFRQLAKKYHPDKNKDKGAQDEFIKIFKAYETLSDETKRREYDQRSRTSDHQNTFNHWQPASNMHDFDINEFFKQYEDQLFRHSQQFHQHHSQHHQHHHNNAHQQSFFHGVNLEDLFHDLDEDEFINSGRMFSGSFGGGHNLNHDQYHNGIHQGYHHDSMDGTFGDGASFFGAYLPSQIHDTIHKFQHHQDYPSSSSHASSFSCHTVTKQVNGMTMTQTSCG